MSENKKTLKFSGLLDKLKKIKHLDIILVVLFIAIILLIYFSSFSKSSTSGTTNYEVTTESTSFEKYRTNLEQKIKTAVEALENVEHAEVILYFDKGAETVIAYTYETEILPDGTKQENKSPVLIQNGKEQNVVVLQEIMPQPASAVIVASGAKDTNVKLKILQLVQALFEIKSSKVEIFAGN
jgi:predicted subunit of tRNA(5-methylaminomethyl-2-thiouridylate) methyltransferase